MKTLHHRTFLGRHQSARLRADDAERVLKAVRIEPEHARCRRGRRKST
jgi:hypothetical protein